MRTRPLLLAAALVLGGAAPASADNEPCQGEDSCRSRSEREFNFHDSPIQTGDITLCAPMSTCHFDGEDEPAPEG